MVSASNMRADASRHTHDTANLAHTIFNDGAR
jgi:hypothetical protein